MIGNRNEYSKKQIQIISLQPYYVSTLPDKTNNITKTADRLLQHSVEPIVPKFYRKSLNVRFFPTKNLLYMLIGFIENLSSNLKWLILTCKLKLNCGDMRRVTVMTSSS